MPTPKSAKTQKGANKLDMLLDVPLRVSVVLGRTRMPIQDLLQLSAGSVVELDRLTNEPLEVLVNGKLIARGEAVVVNERLGIRITEIVNTDAVDTQLDESA